MDGGVFTGQGAVAMPEERASDFLEDVLPGELREISRRRRKVLPDRSIPSLQPFVDGLEQTEREIEQEQKAFADIKRSNRLRRLIHKILPLQAIINAEKRLKELSERRSKQEAELTEASRRVGRRTQLGLVGLAFSGGGIRSATFNLGILQSLADLRVLKFFDYLSTVSGGGYIGSWFSGWIWRERESPAGGIATVEEKLKPGHQAKQANLAIPDEPRPIYHLRQYSNYLTPQLGLFSQDTWSAIATYIRNLFLNQLILIPALAAVLLVPRLVGKIFKIDADAGSMWVSVVLLITGVSFGVAMWSVVSSLNRLRQSNAQRFQLTDLQWRICVPILVASIGFSWLGRAQKSLVQQYEGFTWLTQILHVQDSNIWINWIFVFAILNLAIHLQPAVYLQDEERFWRYVVSALLSGGVAGILLFCLVHFGLWNWSDRPWDAVTWGPPLGVIIFLLAVTVHVGVMGIYEPDEWREWRASMGAWLLIYSLAWVGIFAISFYGPLGWQVLVGWTKTKATFILGWVGSTVAAILAGKSSQTNGSGGSSWLQWVTKLCPAIAVIGLLMAIALLSHTIVDKWSLNAGDPSLQAACRKETPENQKVPQDKLPGTAKLAEKKELDVSVRLEKNDSTSKALVDRYKKQVNCAEDQVLWILFSLCLITAAGLARTVDVNEFSLHAFYRNRLVRCYLGASRKKTKPKSDQKTASGRDEDIRQPDPITGFDPNDDFLLKNLCTTTGYDGPYPIIDTALNLTSGKELAWQQRKASSFVLTPRYCGSMETGYRETEEFSGRMKLGTAFAISGAAASPNMGYHTSAPMAFLLTLFNVRLGWWVGNPARQETWTKPGPRWSLSYLLTELFGQTDAECRYVYLSDGGHFENLGIYELVRRRCKYIVCCDAGADSEMEVEDLGNAIRKIRADQGVDIEIDLDMVRRQEGQRYSRWHHAIGVIRYDQADPNESVGMLIYIKASLTGDESGDVLEYAGQHTSFPHQATVDQFFDESQFESYRKLGEHIAWEIFRYAQPKENDGPDAVFNELRRHWVSVPPDIQESFLRESEALVKLEARLRDNPQLARYDSETFPELERILGIDPNTLPERDKRMELHFCNMQLQLMENVFFALNLQKYHSYALNRGWMNLFRRWAVTPTFQQLWPSLRGNHSKRFVDFVEEYL